MRRIIVVLAALAAISVAAPAAAWDGRDTRAIFTAAGIVLFVDAIRPHPVPYGVPVYGPPPSVVYYPPPRQIIVDVPIPRQVTRECIVVDGARYCRTVP